MFIVISIAYGRGISQVIDRVERGKMVYGLCSWV